MMKIQNVLFCGLVLVYSVPMTSAYDDIYTGDEEYDNAINQIQAILGESEDLSEDDDQFNSRYGVQFDEAAALEAYSDALDNEEESPAEILAVEEDEELERLARVQSWKKWLIMKAVKKGLKYARKYINRYPELKRLGKKIFCQGRSSSRRSGGRQRSRSSRQSRRRS